jgi:hypothetical protein
MHRLLSRWIDRWLRIEWRLFLDQYSAEAWNQLDP